MAEEIMVCRDKLEMKWKEIGQCYIHGAEAAFIDDPKEKQELIDTITRRVRLWVAKNEKISALKMQMEQARNGKFKNAVFGIATVLSSYILIRGINQL